MSVEAFDMEKVKVEEKGLVPCIVQDAETKRVLTLAYMNRESLGITLEKGLTCFWSRSRQELWLKGATSGNYQHIVTMEADCDCDAILVQVRKDGRKTVRKWKRQIFKSEGICTGSRDGTDLDACATDDDRAE